MTTAKKKTRVPLASMPAFGPRELSCIREVMQEAAKLFGPRSEQLIFEQDRLKIEAEYNTLVSTKADHAKSAADAAQVVAKSADQKGKIAMETASQAVVAGETAINSLQTIAEQPKKFFFLSLQICVKPVWH